ILPIAIGIVIEPDAWISRNPWPKGAESSAGRSAIRGLQNLRAVPVESDHRWIRAGYGGLHNVTISDVNCTLSRLEVPIASIRAIPTGDMAIRVAGHHAAIGFISRDAVGRDSRPQPQFHFMTASAGRYLVDLDCGRNRLCRTPLAREDGRRIAKLCRLANAVSQAGGGLHIPPKTSSSPDSASRPKTRERR